MYYFDKILKRSQKKYSKKILQDLYYSEASAQLCFKLVKEYFENNPDASNSDAFEYFFDKFNDINMELAYMPTIKSDVLRLNICKYLVQNPNELKIAYDKIMREEQRGKSIQIADKVSYKSNKLAATRQAVLQIIQAVRMEKESFPENYAELINYYINLPSKLRTHYKNKLTTEERIYLEEVRDYFEGDEFTQIHKFLKKQIPIFEKNLREDYIESLLFLGEKFKRFSLLEKYNKDYKRILNRLNMNEMQYSSNTVENPDKSLTVEDLFKRETLEKMDLNQLSVLNAFYVNRYTKELKSLNQTFFIIQSLNLWNELRNAKSNEETGFINIEINNNELEDVFKKMYFLNEVCQEIFNNAIEKDFEEEQDTIIKEGNKIVVSRDISSLILEASADLGGEYFEYFSGLNPEMRNDFLREFNTYRIVENSIANAYKLKDYNMIAILSNLQSLNFSKNWGIIFEKGKNPITSKRLLLGIDVEGFNMPVRLHIDREVIEDFFKANQNDEILVPLYEGDSDFVYRGKLVKTPLLMPLSKEQKSLIKQLDPRKVPETQNFVEHIKFLGNFEEYPEHLKKEKVVRKKGKSKIVRRPPDKRYINLKDGKIFSIGKDGELIEVEQKERENGAKNE